jgi:hypothetical protein
LNEQLGVMDADLSGLQSVWDSSMENAYAFYLPRTMPRVALAAALVEGAVSLQRLGGPAPDPFHLLLGDLCLARASRLLADVGDQRMQVGFARAVEQVSAAASGGPDVPSLRDLLLSTVEGRP